MKQKTRILACILALILLLALCACGSSQSSEPANAGDTDTAAPAADSAPSAEEAAPQSEPSDLIQFPLEIGFWLSVLHVQIHCPLRFRSVYSLYAFSRICRSFSYFSR